MKTQISSIEGDGTIASHAEISEDKQNPCLLTWEQNVLGSILSESSLSQVLDALMVGMEKQMPGALCSVLTLDADGHHLRHGGGPSLPDAYSRAIDGAAIDTSIGSHGTAAHEHQPIVVADIASDPAWADHREIALKCGLRTCWSTPIHSNQEKFLGTLAIYYGDQHQPVAVEMELVKRAVQVIRIAIESQHAEQKNLKLHTDLEPQIEERTTDLQTAPVTLNDFKAALDQHAIVAVTDIDGTITYVNDKFSEISKYSKEELLDQNHNLLNASYHPQEFYREMWDTILSGQTWKGEFKNRCKDGSIYWTDSTIVPLLGPEDKTVQFVMISSNITKRKFMEQDLRDGVERLRLATEAAKIGVWEWDLITDQVIWDEQMFEIYGLPPNPQGAVYYSDWASAVLPEDLGEQEARLQHTVNTSGHDQREFRITRGSDHEERVIRGSEIVKTDLHGKPIRMVGINYDATESKQAEARIRELNAALEIRSLEQEAANKEMESFSYSVSHDLRAPLRAVSGFSRMVLDDYAGKIDDEGRRMLGVIHSEAKRMGHLIDDLLAFSRLGRHPIELTKIDMETMAREVFHELAAHQPERKLQLNLSKLPPTFGTESLIRQVWVNLISNAIKFTSPREVGEIEIGTKHDGGDRQIYYIKDNGIGFDSRHNGKLFGVFERLHSEKEFSGTGVGLALVKRIVERHGGRIWADAKVDQGATFYFTLPNQSS